MLTWLFSKTPLIFLTQTFWRDEAFSYFMAKKSLIEILFLTAKDFNPPLYYFVLHYWMKIFGSSEIALRSLSLIFFWGIVYVAFLFLKDIFKLKERKSLFYLLFFIVNPLLIYYAFEARMYSMLAFLATLSYYLFYKKNYRLYFITTLSGLFTSYFMIFVIVSQLLFLFINKHFNFKKSAIYIILIIFFPWVIFFLFQNGLSGGFWLKKPQFHHLLNLLGIIFTGHESYLYPNPLIVYAMEKTTNILSLILTLIVLIGFYLHKKEGKKPENLIFNLLSYWGLGIPLFILLFSYLKAIFIPRYIIYTSVGLTLLLIYILEKIPKLFKNIFIILIITLSIYYQLLQVSFRSKHDIRKKLAEINILANKNDLIYVKDDLDYFTVRYYLKNKRVFIYGKGYNNIATFNGKTLIPEADIANRLPNYPIKAFIITGNGNYTIQSVY